MISEEAPVSNVLEFLRPLRLRIRNETHVMPLSIDTYMSHMKGAFTLVQLRGEKEFRNIPESGC